MAYISMYIAVFGLGSGIAVAVILRIALGRLKRKQDEQEETEKQDTTSFVFSGNLKQTNLLEAVQFLEMGVREGILHIYCGRRKGYIIFNQGKIIDAFYRDEIGKQALLRMFDIDDGDFYFEPKKIRQPRVMNEPIINLALEWAERKENTPSSAPKKR